MSDPFARATASAPPTLGEGCLRRFDPERMDETLGADFAAAAALWDQQAGIAGAAGDRPSAPDLSEAALD